MPTQWKITPPIAPVLAGLPVNVQPRQTQHNTTGVIMSIILEMESLEQPFSTGGSFVSTTIIGIFNIFYILFYIL